jgi:KDO2-lipid IV(A) lauroyltransferase
MRILKVLLGLFFLLLMAAMPMRLSQFLGKQLGRYWFKSKSSRSYQVSKLNIDSCFADQSSEYRVKLLAQSLEHTGMSYAEMGMSWLWPSNWTLRRVVSVEGLDVLNSAIANDKGVIIIAPHIGNWEVLNLYASNLYPITVLYKQPKLKFFDWLINKMRKRLGGDMAPANAAGVRKLMKKLRAKGVIAILPDQEPAEGSGEFSPFFGRDTYTMTLLSQLASKTQSTVIAGVAFRQDNGQGFAIKFTEVAGNINSRDTAESIAALNQSIETIVKQCPAQYQWEYKRFKKQPDGQSRLY